MNFNKYKTLSNQYDVSFGKSEYRKSLKRLLLKKTKSLGRSSGQIIMWHRGGGVKRNFRPILNYKNAVDNYAILRSIEYDPNRNARICLVSYEDGEKRYILHPRGVNINDIIFASISAPILPGNALPLSAVWTSYLTYRYKYPIWPMTRSIYLLQSQIFFKKGTYLIRKLW